MLRLGHCTKAAAITNKEKVRAQLVGLLTLGLPVAIDGNHAVSLTRCLACSEMGWRLRQVQGILLLADSTSVL